MSCLPAFPVSQLPWPGSDEARAMTVGSGKQCAMLLEESSPLGAFSKILLASSAWTNSEEYCYVWERLDTRFGCSAFQLTALEQSTSEDGSSLLPTSHANCSTGAGTQGRNGGMNLQTAVKLWPTPTERDWKSTSHGNQDNARPLSEVAGLTGSGSLNPRFVEELMGFAIDHTDLKHSATVSFPSKSTPFSKRLPK